MSDSQDDLKIGVAGGGFGRVVHVPGLKATPGVSIVAIAVSQDSKARSIADALGVKDAYGSVTELLKANLDAVTFALPPDVNEQAIEAAVESRMPFLSEKPVGVSYDWATSMRACPSGLITAVDFEFGETHTFRELREAVLGGAMGSPVRVDIAWRVESWAHKRRIWSWKTDALRGGGVLSLLGSHVFYLAEWIFGPIADLRGSLDYQATAEFTPFGSLPAPDSAWLDMTTESGVPISVDMSVAAPGERRHSWKVEFESGDLLIAANEDSDWVSGFSLHREPSDEGAEALAEDHGGGNDGRLAPFVALASRFVAAVRDGRPMTPDFAAGVRVQQLMDAVVKASETDVPIKISTSRASSAHEHGRWSTS